ncbi:MAG: hypothetical protein ACW99G_03670 [Candidatus Thorarchaeota archaeon]|jgi:hypothetical protein
MMFVLYNEKYALYFSLEDKPKLVGVAYKDNAHKFFKSQEARSYCDDNFVKFYPDHDDLETQRIQRDMWNPENWNVKQLSCKVSL